MKKWLGIILFLIVLGLVFAAAADTVSGSCLVVYSTDPYSAGGDTDHNWTLDLSTGELTITGSGALKSYSNNYSNPWNNDKYADCHDYRNEIKSIVVEEGTTTLPGHIFSGFTYLESVKLPNSLKIIGSYAFSGCKFLETVQVGSGLQEIQIKVFENCETLKELNLPENITIIDVYSFAYCKAVRFTAVESDTAKSLSKSHYTFWDKEYPGLEMEYTLTEKGEIDQFDIVGSDATIDSIKWPAGVTRIKGRAFINCAKLTEVSVPEGVTDIDSSAFLGCKSLNKLELPASLKRIGGEAFSSCDELKELNLPDNITGLNGYPFKGSKAIRYAKVDSVTAKTLSKSGYTFWDKAYPGLEMKYELTEEGEIEQFDIVASDATIDSIKWPAGVTRIKGRAFVNCATLTEVSIPEGVTEIDSSAFSGCKSLGKLELPSSLRKITGDAFSGCDKLQELDLPDNITDLSGYPFKTSNAIRYATVGSVTAKTLSREGYPFRDKNYPGLDCIYTVSDEGEITQYRIKKADKTISSCKIPKYITNVDSGAFASCNSLTDVYYDGNRKEWEAIKIESRNDPLLNARKHLSTQEYTVTLTASDTKAGKATATPASGLEGTSVTLAATASEGYQFKEWQVSSGDVSITDNKFTIGTDDVEINAVFEEAQPEPETISATVTLKVVNGTWKDGTREDKKIVLTGHKGDELRLPFENIPDVNKPDEGYSAETGSWDTEPPFVLDGQNYGDPITKDAVYTYTYGEAPKATLTKAPKAKDLVFNSQLQELVTAGEAKGGKVVYAPGKDSKTAPEAKAYTDKIPTAKETGTYYTWYKVSGDKNHTDTEPACIITNIIDKVEAFVSRCYKLILNREPDKGGLQGWCEALNSKAAAASNIIDSFVRSEEFTNRKLSDDAKVDILYQTMLDRPADAGGKAGWVDALSKGYTLQHIINGFCGSDEFSLICANFGIEAGTVNAGPVTPPVPDTPRGKIEAFVQRCYKLILSRQADEGGLKGWSDALETRTAAAAQIIDGFVRSQEYTNRNLSDGESVDILYKTMLDREADAGGKAGWVDALSKGYTLQHIINGFCGSQEFTAICDNFGIIAGSVAVSGAMVKREAITPEGDEAEAPVVYQGYNSEFINEEKIKAFVEHCYVSVFGREGDAEGVENYTKAILDGNKTPKKVAYEFIFSPEFQSKLPGNEAFIRILYRLYFNREADAEGLAGWVQMLEGGACLEDIVNGFAGSDEFKAIVNGLKD